MKPVHHRASGCLCSNWIARLLLPDGRRSIRPPVIEEPFMKFEATFVAYLFVTPLAEQASA